ncbi:MAG: hypothetical protein A2X49_03895 [Lentisphaerae bacterium GWF2_52_8]|nr:MAG: hypothetical protein A2X49_03895 [Lentisphaerae bacterium GWF2_52_8]
MFIKICGLTREDDLLAALDAGVEALGFVAYSKSARFVPPSLLSRLLKDVPVPPGVRKVGVFVDASKAEIGEYLDAGIDIIQLHGEEDADFAASLRSIAGAEVWRALRPRTVAEIEALRNFPADKFVLDAFVADKPGGTGRIADWPLAILAARVLPGSLLLAGGLNPDNVGAGISQVKPFGVDVSSGVESSPGKKDSRLITAFVNACREAASHG